MNNRFDNKFKNNKKSDSEVENISAEFLTAGTEQNIIKVEDDVLNNVELPERVKKVGKTYYIDSKVAKELEDISKKNKTSSSQLLNSILKQILKVD